MIQEILEISLTEKDLPMATMKTDTGDNLMKITITRIQNNIFFLMRKKICLMKTIMSNRLKTMTSRMKIMSTTKIRKLIKTSKISQSLLMTQLNRKKIIKMNLLMSCLSKRLKTKHSSQMNRKMRQHKQMNRSKILLQLSLKFNPSMKNLNLKKSYLLINKFKIQKYKFQ